VLHHIADPTGGTFDAVRDFDRLVPTVAGGLLDAVDPYGDTVFDKAQAAQMVV
jgi:hypothetical protein